MTVRCLLTIVCSISLAISFTCLLAARILTSTSLTQSTPWIFGQRSSCDLLVTERNSCTMMINKIIRWGKFDRIVISEYDILQLKKNSSSMFSDKTKENNYHSHYHPQHHHRICQETKSICRTWLTWFFFFTDSHG